MYSIAVNVVDLDPHHFGNLNPHPHQIKIRIRMHQRDQLNLEPDPDRHQFVYDKPKCMENEPF
jgi:hypothetical protein